jgi:Zn-dependent protease with chaperone function
MTKQKMQFLFRRLLTRQIARLFSVIFMLAMFSGCAGIPLPGRSEQSGGSSPPTVKIDPSQAERIQRIMIPLLKSMDNPLQPGEVKIGIIDSPDINAANAGGGEFYITTGLLQRADENQLRGVLAHEVAHDDLGHVAKTQALGTGLQIGTIILDQILPGSGNITPYIADLGVLRPFSRKEEYSADEHGAEILRRAGYNGQRIMADTLTWMLKSTGPGGGFFATHPGTDDRIERIRDMS